MMRCYHAKSNHREINCKSNSYLNNCGVETCYKVLGEECTTEDNKYSGGKCDASLICIDNICHGVFENNGMLNPERKTGRTSLSQLSKKRNQIPYPRTQFPFANYFDENSYENSYHPEELQLM